MKINFTKKQCKKNVIKKMLEEDNDCYVLITCKKATQSGKMQVELNYFGDDYLAAYLVDGAQSVFEDKLNQEHMKAQDNY